MSRDDISHELSQRNNMSASRPSTPASDASKTTFGESCALVIPLTSRSIGYSTFGDPDGSPLFFFHGLPGSRYDGRYMADVAEKHHVRIIGVDRPGYGLSTFDASRSVRDYAADILALADHLEIDTFRVIGLSGGGPYALACALNVPPSRLLATGVYEGIGPIHETGLRGMGYGLYAKISWWLFIHFPSLGRWLARNLIFRSLLNSADPADTLNKVMAKAIKRMKDPEQKAMFEQARTTIVASMVEAFRQGSEGYCFDGELLARDWGFKIRDIPPDRRIRMWYGRRDAFTPVKTARYVVEQLGGREVEGFYADKTSRYTDAPGEDVEGEDAVVQLRVYREGDHEKLLLGQYKEDIINELMGL